MKKILNIFIALFFASFAFAQQTSNLVIFAEEATPFYAVVNGIKQNVEPQTNVKITGLTNQANQVKVIFKDPMIPTLDKQIYFQEMNVEATLKIANTNKGYKLRYFGEVSMGSAVVEPTQNVISYQTVEPTSSTPVVTNATQPATTTTTTVVQETVTSNNGSRPVKEVVNSENINMNVNVGGVGFNMGVQVNDMIDLNENVTIENATTSTTTTTTTTTTSAATDNTYTSEVVSAPIQYVDGYNGRVGCSIPSQSLSSIKAAVDAESFSDDKMMVAKQATKNKCLTTSQVKEIANLFDFEDDKLEYAKYAYAYTYDVENYYQINSIFSFSSSKTELNEFINK